MKQAFLTSWLGGANKAGGTRVPAVLCPANGLLDRLKAIWPENARVLFISASPADHEKNDLVLSCQKVSFPLSGLSISSMEMCDDRNVQVADCPEDLDVIVLTGGHVPTQNAFFHRISLKEKLSRFNGLLIAWSAGSMNCASTVYAGPELDGEAVDPAYQRWIPGLGLTDINIYPHYDRLKDDWLDGMRLMEDITYPDSYRHEILAIPDGSYILIDNGTETLYGEGWSILNGKLRKICDHGESSVLKSGK